MFSSNLSSGSWSTGTLWGKCQLEVKNIQRLFQNAVVAERSGRGMLFQRIGGHKLKTRDPVFDFTFNRNTHNNIILLFDLSDLWLRLKSCKERQTIQSCQLFRSFSAARNTRKLVYTILFNINRSPDWYRFAWGTSVSFATGNCVLLLTRSENDGAKHYCHILTDQHIQSFVVVDFTIVHEFNLWPNP